MVAEARQTRNTRARSEAPSRDLLLREEEHSCGDLLRVGEAGCVDALVAVLQQVWRGIAALFRRFLVADAVIRVLAGCT